MSSKALQIVRMTRFPQRDKGDDLSFRPGVNVIVGDKDSGKTKWLTMLDYLMGDRDPPERAFGADLAEKYERAQAVVRIGDNEYLVERRWKEEGNRTKVFVNGKAIHFEHFSEYILELLGIPALRVPRGDPYADREWPELSWRELLRHVYRQERFWNDFAQEQPLVQQHACLAQFLAIGEAIHPPEFRDLVKKQKELAKLQADRESYLAMLKALTRELLRQQELTVDVTEASIRSSEQRIKQELGSISVRRKELLDNIASEQQAEQDSRYSQMQKELNAVESERERLIQVHQKLLGRITEMEDYRRVTSVELEKNQRLQSSADILADLKVTYCPVCDQRVAPDGASTSCFLCRQPYARSDEAPVSASLRRLEFEADQLKEESEEVGQLIDRLKLDAEETARQLSLRDEELHRLNADLLPARQLAAALLPPDLALLDEEQGRLQEQLAQLSRVRSALRLQDELTDRIRALEKAESALSDEVSQRQPDANLSKLSAILQDGMNDYMNALNASELTRWQHPPLRFVLGRNDFAVFAGKQPWNEALGSASRAMVLLAYHYALLSLVEHDRFNYPGVVIVDFPVELAEGVSVADKENYLVEPFIDLCRRLGTEKAQFIAAGRSFAGLEGANRIELPMWTEAPDLDGDSLGLSDRAP